ncbi:MAG: hypothetical protein EXR58_02495 [Chloroflexi bacterium]|nr:hypothetical protein [Chloroflexota bacterium]
MTHSGSPRSLRVRQYAAGTVAIVASLAATAVVLLAPIPYRAMGEYGYLGVFAVTLLGTASFVIPVPYLAVIVAAGSYLPPLSVALVAAVAAALGEVTGYVAGYAGRSLIPEAGWADRLRRLMARSGSWVVFVAALVPNPFFDLIGALAGATRFSPWAFFSICFAARALRYWPLAAVGGPLLGI